MKILFLLMVSGVSLANASPMRINQGELGSGMLYVPCTFDSHAEECLLDTGSDVSNISDDAFAETYASIGKTTGEGLSGEPTQCDVIDVAQMGLGDGFANHPKMVRCPSNVQQGGSVAGLTALAGKTIHLNFTENTFGLNDAIPRGASTFPLARYPLGHFGFQATTSGIAFDSVIDTGAGLTTIDKNFVQAHPDQFTFVENIPDGVDDSNGDPITLVLYTMKELSFSGVSLQNVSVMAGDFSPLGKYLPNVVLIIGYNILIQKNWYFDLLNNLWN